MSNSYVQLAADQTGKKAQSFENTVGANVVEACAVSSVNAAGYSDSFVRIIDTMTGKKMQCFENTVGSNSVLALAVVLVDATGAPI